MYKNNNICVKIKKKLRKKEFLQSNVGVLQGDSIRPLLFHLYMSDLKASLGVDDDRPNRSALMFNVRR